MPEKHTMSRPPEPTGGQVVDLQAAVTSLVSSFLTARVALDAETARIAKLYQEHEILRLFAPPAFSLGEVTVRMPYAAVDVFPPFTDIHESLRPDELPHMRVQVGAETLAHLPPHAVASVEIKLSQDQLSVMLNPPQP